MYTLKEQARAAEIIRMIAKEQGISVAQVRADMKMAMYAGMSNPDPAVQAKWKEFHYVGAEPTVDEFILWTASQFGK